MTHLAALAALAVRKRDSCDVQAESGACWLFVDVPYFWNCLFVLYDSMILLSNTFSKQPQAEQSQDGSNDEN